MKLRVKVGDQSFDVEVGDVNARPILAKVEGETFEVWQKKQRNGLKLLQWQFHACRHRSPGPGADHNKGLHKCVLLRSQE